MTRRHLSTVPERGNRVVLYVRVSALMGRAGDDFHSPAMQTKAMRDLVARRGLREIGVVEDIDVSGRTFAREGIQRILEMARGREIDVVALYDLSRLGRNTAESLRTIATLRELGVSVTSTIEQIDDTPEGQFQLGVFLGMAQLYSDQIGRRWREVHQHRADKGLPHGPAPLGYDRVAGRLIPNLLGAHVTALFDGYARGALISHLALAFSAARGKSTALAVVKRMLRNPIYIGKVRYAGEVHDGVHERLVSQRTWERVQRRLEQDGRTPSRVLAGANPTAGLVRCEHCKRPMRMQAENRAAGIVRLRCDTRETGKGCSGPGAPLLAEVEEALVRRICEGYGERTGDMAAAATRRAARSRATVDARRLRGEIARLDQALTTATANLYRSDVTEDEHRGAVKILREERSALLALLSTAERAVTAPQGRGMVKLAAELERRWLTMSDDEKRRVLQGTVEVAWLRRAVRWREPVYDRLDVRLL